MFPARGCRDTGPDLWVQSAVTRLQSVLASHLPEHRSPGPPQKHPQARNQKEFVIKEPWETFLDVLIGKILQSKWMGNNRKPRSCESWTGEEERGKGDASLRFIDGKRAILISKSIGALKEKNNDERECERGLSVGCIQRSKGQVPFSGRWGRKIGIKLWVTLFFLSEWKQTVTFFPSLMLTSLS